MGDWLADIVTGTPATAPENQDEESTGDEAEDTPTPSVVEEDDPFVDGKRPTYLLHHQPSQRNIKEPKKLDLKLWDDCVPPNNS